MVFTKSPVEGQVKTRMIPRLGEAGAFNLYWELLKEIFHRIQTLPVEKSLWVSGDSNTEALLRLAQKQDMKLMKQQGSDLGEKLAQAFESSLSDFQHVLVIGGDCVSLDAKYLETAFKTLSGKPCVVGPASDGGFVMLGFSKYVLDANNKLPDVFKDIPWGESEVSNCLRANLNRSSIDFDELEERWDVDEPKDLSCLKGIPRFAKFLP
jgi:rSAM/selenodomain-associated transferase 1